MTWLSVSAHRLEGLKHVGGGQEEEEADECKGGGKGSEAHRDIDTNHFEERTMILQDGKREKQDNRGELDDKGAGGYSEVDVKAKDHGMGP